MVPKTSAPRAYFLAMGILLPLLGVGGSLYFLQQKVPLTEAAPILAAILIEAAMFFSMGNDAVRRWWRPWMVAASVGVPALLVGGSPGVLAIATVLTYWYLVLPRRAWTDAAYVLLWAGLTLGKVSQLLYPGVVAKIPLSILGELAWIRIVIWAVLEVRKQGGVGFGFVPTRREVGIGLKWFLAFLPVGALAGWAIGWAHVRPAPWNAGKMALNGFGTFVGIYVFVALRENFVLRGMLLQWMTGWLRSSLRAQIVVAVIAGLAHLPFRDFPNWRFAIIAAMAHFVYGRAYLEAGSIRAAMICHALVVMIWRVFLVS